MSSRGESDVRFGIVNSNMLTYTYRYNRVIQWFRDHPITKESHPDSEVHHIVPQSCGGEDVKENKVLLPTRWHYIVHCWLPTVYLEQGNQECYKKMLFAWNRMQNYREDFRSGLYTIKEDSWLYQKLRHEFCIVTAKMNAKNGKENSQYRKHWWKDPNDKTKSLSIKEGDPVPEGWVPGHWHNEHQKNRKTKKIQFCSYCGAEMGKCKNPEICKSHKISNALKEFHKIHKNSMFGKHHSIKSKIKMRNSHLGKNNNQYGKMWICNDDTHENKIILKTNDIPNGWRKGRICK